CAAVRAAGRFVEWTAALGHTLHPAEAAEEDERRRPLADARERLQPAIDVFVRRGLEPALSALVKGAGDGGDRVGLRRMANDVAEGSRVERREGRQIGERLVGDAVLLDA